MTGTPWAFNTSRAHSLQAGRARDGQRLKMVHRVRQMGHRWNEVFFPMCITYSEKYKQLPPPYYYLFTLSDSESLGHDKTATAVLFGAVEKLCFQNGRCCQFCKAMLGESTMTCLKWKSD